MFAIGSGQKFVFYDLGLNAREAMPLGGELVMATSRAKASDPDSPRPDIVLTVKDTGRGMELNTLAHIFEPFYSTKAKTTGSIGLGLSMVYGTIRQNGGTISVTSEPGRGAEFEIRFPAAEGLPPDLKSNQLSEAGEEQRVDPVLPSGGTLLLVEDEDAVRKLASHFLRVKGFQVMEARDGDEAWSLFEKHRERISIVVTDVVMPYAGGLELAGRIFTMNPDTPLVFMSGYTEDSLTPQAMSAMKASFLQKPFSAADLLEKVAEAIHAKSPAS